MKKKIILFVLFIFLLNFISATTCKLDVSLLNQDPYYAVPGDYVEIVFQIKGTENSKCSSVYFELIQDYPFLLDPGADNVISIKGGTFVKDFNSYLMVPYKLRVDENALDGESPIKVKFSTTNLNQSYQTELFNISIKDTRVDFEVSIQEYDSLTATTTFEILNIGDNDVEALTIEIEDQENIRMKGNRRSIIGDLDSNDFTTVDFEATPEDGEIEVKIIYTDSVNVRRTLEKTLNFISTDFEDRKKDEKSFPWTIIIFSLLILLVFFLWIRRKKKKQSQRH